MDLTNKEVHDRLAHALRSEFGWQLTVDSDEATGCWASLPVPGRLNHLLRFRSEGNSVGVSYCDLAFSPPDSAEILFVFEPHDLDAALAEGVAPFLRDLVNENVIVLRGRPGCLARLISGSSARGSLWFRRRADVNPEMLANAASVYSWNRTHDRGR